MIPGDLNVQFRITAGKTHETVNDIIGKKRRQGVMFRRAGDEIARKGALSPAFAGGTVVQQSPLALSRVAKIHRRHLEEIADQAVAMIGPAVLVHALVIGEAIDPVFATDALIGRPAAVLKLAIVRIGTLKVGDLSPERRQHRIKIDIGLGQSKVELRRTPHQQSQEGGHPLGGVPVETQQGCPDQRQRNQPRPGEPSRQGDDKAERAQQQAEKPQRQNRGGRTRIERHVLVPGAIQDLDQRLP